MSDAPQLLVARIGKPHGLRGEVTVQTHTDDPERRFVAGTVFATQAVAGSGVPRALTLRTARQHRAIWLLGFDEVPDRTGAESLRGTRLLVDVAEVTEPADDDGYYEDELVGLSVVTVDGDAVGEVTGLETGTAQDLLVVRLSSGAEALVPFVTAIVPEVDVEGGRVVIDPPTGLLELNEGG
ncbi:ribosome maturation factor RimM [Pedococcus sp. 5OH_020]|uniref:ribosome maturation factor RimM n=1 Tax=Pedococcus sp. 5OH_020 TaxID=2989814 RepID=UPI0022EA05DF|nr:ribosome maturation factor RimM [Pedococcus sp. 5OH_020]